jgi:hypothetical protein
VIFVFCKAFGLCRLELAFLQQVDSQLQKNCID